MPALVMAAAASSRRSRPRESASVPTAGGPRLLGWRFTSHTIRLNRPCPLGAAAMHKRANALVLLLILLLVGSLVVVGVAKARAAAATLSCQAHLKRMGIGLWGYHDAHGSFPPGTIPNDGLPFDRRFSWLVALYPYVEDKSGVERLDQSASWDEKKNREVVVPRLNFVACPANPNCAETGEPPLTHYIGVAGLGIDAATLPLNDRRAGFFGYDRKTMRSDIQDKLAFTMTVAETRSENGPWAAGGPATVRGIDPEGPAYISKKGQFGWHSSSSGCNILLADGSVRFVKDSVNPRIIEALATIAGGEEVGDF